MTMNIPETVYPIAQMGDEVLLINKSNIPFIGKDRALEVQSILVDFRENRIFDPIELERHLKFNPWEEITDDGQRTIIRKLIATKFSDIDIAQRIIEPIEKNKLQ